MLRQELAALPPYNDILSAGVVDLMQKKIAYNVYVTELPSIA